MWLLHSVGLTQPQGWLRGNWLEGGVAGAVGIGAAEGGVPFRVVVEFLKGAKAGPIRHISGAGEGAAGPIVDGVAGVAVHSSPAEVADASSSRNTAIAHSIFTGASLAAAGTVVGGVAGVAVHTSPAKVAGGAGLTPAIVAGPILAPAKTWIRHTNWRGNIGSALPLTWLAGEVVVRVLSDCFGDDGIALVHPPSATRLSADRHRSVQICFSYS